jgi:hypothetical protein
MIVRPRTTGSVQADAWTPPVAILRRPGAGGRAKLTTGCVYLRRTLVDSRGRALPRLGCGGYSRGMSADEIRERLRRDPFEPFRFCLTRGDTYEIRDPNSVALGQRRVFIAFPDADRQAFFPYPHIAAVETLGNGHRPRRGRRR